MAKQVKKIPRAERKHSRARCVSLNFPMGMEEVAKESGRAFIPNADYMNLLRKYLWLVKRRRKELDRRCKDGKLFENEG